MLSGRIQELVAGAAGALDQDEGEQPEGHKFQGFRQVMVAGKNPQFSMKGHIDFVESAQVEIRRCLPHPFDKSG